MTNAPNFRERLAQLKAEQPAIIAQPLSPPVTPEPDYSEFAEFIPTVPESHTEERIELDGLMASIDIIDAYQRWCGKSKIPATNKREGIKISCPHPDHPDKDPSAWINLDKQVYFCGGCQSGGDKFDIASTHFGIDYKIDPANFVELKKKMAGDYGWTVKQSLTGKIELEKTKTWEPQPSTPAAPVAPTEPLVAQVTNNTSSLIPETATDTPGELSSQNSQGAKPETKRTKTVAATDPVPDFDLKGPAGSLLPSIDWPNIVAENTFLDVWMREMCHDDLPEEYYFWLGLQAIGAAVGRAVSLEDSQPVFPNLMCCLIGDTGQGKSRSSSRLTELLQKALPYDYADPMTKGVKNVPLPGSGEALMKYFSNPLNDINNPKVIIGYMPVRGLVNFDEFSNLTTRGARSGSTLQQTLMSLFDGYVSTHAIGSITSGVTQVESPFCLGLATTQPRNIQNLVNSADKSSGFLNRWVFVTGPPKEPITLQKHRFDLKSSIDKLKEIFTWAGKQRTVLFTTDGERAYEKLFEEFIRPVKLGSDPTEGLLSRLDLAAKKIMLLLCINERRENIDEYIVGLTSELLRYVYRTFLFVDGLVGNHEDANVQKAITEVITKHFEKFNRPIKKRELFIGKLVNQFGSEKLVRVMRGMAELGFLEEVEANSGRGPKWKGYMLTKLEPVPDPTNSQTEAKS